ncbi:hypothetical protein ACFLXT_01995 [Chloroflexota bacterium]
MLSETGSTGNGAQPIKGQRSTEEDNDWINFAREKKRSSIGTLNDVGKLLFALPITLITVYIAIAAAFQITDNALALTRVEQLIPVFLWIIGGAFAFWSLFPRKYAVYPNSPSEIQTEHENTVNSKFWKLWLSAVIFGIGLVFAGLVIITD